jgi:hypothetical protein
VPKVVSAVAETLGRVNPAVPESRQKRIEREMVNLVISSGGRLTDSLEFEMTQRLLGETSHLVETQDK